MPRRAGRPPCTWRSPSTALAGIPAAWREADAQPQRLFTAGYWIELAQQAERGLLDFVTIEDGLGPAVRRPLRPDERTDRVRGRLDAVLIAARAAPADPAHRVRADRDHHPHRAVPHFQGDRHAGLRQRRPGRGPGAGRRAAPTPRRTSAAARSRRWTSDRLADPDVQRLIAEHFDEAADYVEVLRRLWDSWEDDAEIRDVATGRFIDRDKLHYIDFEGRWFSVRGPSITPRPPQGQPVVAALGHATVPYRLIARSADVGFVTPRDAAQRRRDRRRDPRPSRRWPAGRTRPCTSSATWWCSSTQHRGRRRPRASSAWTSGPGPRVRAATPSIFAGTAAAAGRPAAGLAGSRAGRVPAAARPPCRTT